MIRKYIERRETFLHGRDNNRRSLPFEWGAEELGLHANGNAASAVHDYVNRALNDTDRFYSYEPATKYELDGEILKFPSGVETPFAENNTVWGRFFPAGKDLAVIVLPQWNCKWEGQIQFCRALQRVGVTTLKLSLPYHHHRK